MTLGLLIILASIVSAGIAPWFVYARLGRIERRLSAVECGLAMLLEEGLELPDDDPDGGIPVITRAGNVITLGRAA